MRELQIRTEISHEHLLEHKALLLFTRSGRLKTCNNSMNVCWSTCVLIRSSQLGPACPPLPRPRPSSSPCPSPPFSAPSHLTPRSPSGERRHSSRGDRDRKGDHRDRDRGRHGSSRGDRRDRDRDRDRDRRSSRRSRSRDKDRESGRYVSTYSIGVRRWC